MYSFGLIIAAGYLWRFFNPGGIDRSRARHALSSAVLHFFLPALAFHAVSSAPADRSFIAVPLTAAATTLLCMAAGFAFYRVVPWFNSVNRPAFGVLVLSAGFGNVTYLGLPVITGLLGASYGYIAIVYDLLAATPILLTIGVFVAARYGSGATPSPAASIKRVLMLPPLWGVAAGGAVLIAGVSPPAVLLDAAGLMGRAVVPIMIFTVGLALDFKDLSRVPRALPALAIKLFLGPLLAWWIGAKAGLSGEQLQAVTIEGAMPVMVLSLVIADEFGLDVPLAAITIAFSTILVFFTLPFMMRLLHA